jgi:hypothetical protein
MPQTAPLQRALPHLALLFSTSLLISACGGGGAGGSPTGGESSLTSVSGVVADYPFSSDAQLSAVALEVDNLTLATGNVRAGNPARVTLELLPASLIPARELQQLEPPCDGATLSDPNTRATAFTGVDVLQGTRLLGSLVHGDGDLDLDAGALSLTVYLYMFSDRPARFSGTCVEEGVVASYNLTLQRGWNIVTGQISLDAASESARLSLTRASNASATPWLFTEDWLSPFGATVPQPLARAVAYVRGLPMLP